MKLEKTYKEVFELEQAAAFYIQKNEEVKNKMTESIRLFFKQVQKIREKYNDELSMLRIDNAAVDEKTKVLLMDEKGNYKFTKEGAKALIEGNKQLLETKVTVHTRICNEVPSDLADEQKEIFAGVLIPVLATEEVKPTENAE